jgi:CspA family cold shock protein
MATRLPCSRQMPSAMKARQPLPSCENPASGKKHRKLLASTHGRLRLPVNFDSSQRQRLAVLLHQALRAGCKRDAGRTALRVTTGTVISYELARGEWLIALDDGHDCVFIDWSDWRGAALSIGEQITFQMIHKPQGVYALPVSARNDTETGP